MLLPRLLTAVVGIPLLLWLIHLGSFPFLAFTVGVAVLALYEYGIILWMDGRGVQPVTLVLGGGLVALSVSLGGASAISRNALSAIIITVVVFAAIVRELVRAEHSLERAALTVFGVFFIGWTLAHLALLRALEPYGEQLTFFLFSTIWVTDMAAYAVGKTIGSRRLAPVVSPKKTWEGAIGGLVAAALFTFPASRLFMAHTLRFRSLFALAIIIGVIGQLSDLAESLVKRSAGVKDSSHLLPGHGGVFDRFDSFLLTAPIMYYAILLCPVK